MTHITYIHTLSRTNPPQTKTNHKPNQTKNKLHYKRFLHRFHIATNLLIHKNAIKHLQIRHGMSEGNDH